MLSWTFFAVVFFWINWRIARHFIPNPLLAFVWLLVVISAFGYSPNVFFAVLSVLCLVHHFYLEERRWSVIGMLMAAALAWTGLIKFTSFVLGAVVMVIIALDDLLRRRRVPLGSCVFTVALAMLWFFAGQHISNICQFLISSWEIADGYTEAMALDKSAIETLPYLVCATLLLIVASTIEWRKRGFWGWLSVCGLAAVLFLVFKHGFVRQSTHSPIGMVSLFATAIVYTIVVWQSLIATWPSSVRARCPGVVSVIYPIPSSGWAAICRRPQGWCTARGTWMNSTRR